MVADVSPMGRIGVLLIGTRGADGPGEVLIRIRGGSETYLAFSDEPIAKGTTVLVVESRGLRSVAVAPWSDPFTVT
jgi:membrane-bound ClpP family serine protease